MSMSESVIRRLGRFFRYKNNLHKMIITDKGYLNVLGKVSIGKFSKGALSSSFIEIMSIVDMNLCDIFYYNFNSNINSNIDYLIFSKSCIVTKKGHYFKYVCLSIGDCIEFLVRQVSMDKINLNLPQIVKNKTNIVPKVKLFVLKSESRNYAELLYSSKPEVSHVFIYIGDRSVFKKNCILTSYNLDLDILHVSTNMHNNNIHTLICVKSIINIPNKDNTIDKFVDSPTPIDTEIYMP